MTGMFLRWLARHRAIAGAALMFVAIAMLWVSNRRLRTEIERARAREQVAQERVAVSRSTVQTLAKRIGALDAKIDGINDVITKELAQSERRAAAARQKEALELQRLSSVAERANAEIGGHTPGSTCQEAWKWLIEHSP